MWKPWTWATASHEQAVSNARTATTECSRRRLERTEVELYLATQRGGDDTHTVAAPAGHPA